jgi:hypothetical protein
MITAATIGDGSSSGKIEPSVVDVARGSPKNRKMLAIYSCKKV